MKIRSVAQGIAAYGFGFAAAIAASGFVATDSKEASGVEAQEARRPPNEGMSREKSAGTTSLLPDIRVVSATAKQSERESMIRANPHLGFITWGAIERAERELIQPDIAMYLGDGDDMGLDCFLDDGVLPEFTYELFAVVTPDEVSVGSFTITRSSLSPRTKSCIEELFAGTVTLGRIPVMEEAGQHYLPVNTTLQRESDFVARVTRDLRKNGREGIRMRVQENLLK